MLYGVGIATLFWKKRVFRYASEQGKAHGLLIILQTILLEKGTVEMGANINIWIVEGATLLWDRNYLAWEHVNYLTQLLPSVVYLSPISIELFNMLIQFVFLDFYFAVP